MKIITFFKISLIVFIYFGTCNKISCDNTLSNLGAPIDIESQQNMHNATHLTDAEVSLENLAVAVLHNMEQQDLDSCIITKYCLLPLLYDGHKINELNHFSNKHQSILQRLYKQSLATSLIWAPYFLTILGKDSPALLFTAIIMNSLYACVFAHSFGVRDDYNDYYNDSYIFKTTLNFLRVENFINSIFYVFLLSFYSLNSDFSTCYQIGLFLSAFASVSWTLVLNYLTIEHVT